MVNQGVALFYISAWKGKQQGAPFWKTSVVANTMEESYLIGKAQFETENPTLNSDDYTLIATGDDVEKSITT